ncbi:MAG: PglZ domain-containing protein [Deltaproteobacteria bacterium]|nr:PglZ domain-containing protein [Deltaproteobacteria bacterium]
MHPSGWVREEVERRAKHHPVVWVEDPYALLHGDDLRGLKTDLEKSGTVLAVVNNGFRLREFLDALDPDKGQPRFVLVDQSYTLREPHLLPKDAKPDDLRPLAAPDWRPRLSQEARFRPTVRDFLVAATDFDDWPGAVNIHPYRELAREHPAGFAQAYESFRRMGRTATSEDLVLIGASALLGADLFNLGDPIAALEVAFHRPDGWKKVEEVFNPSECEVVRTRLRGLPRPLGDLFDDHPETARAAVAGMVVLKQHFPDDAGVRLARCSPAFESFRTFDVSAGAGVPQWFVTDEVPVFEQHCDKAFLEYLQRELELKDEEHAARFAEAEKLSDKLRGLVAFEARMPSTPPGGSDQDFRVERLVPEFRNARDDLAQIVGRLRMPIENLTLVATKSLSARRILDLFADGGLHRTELLAGLLDSQVYRVENAARRQWDGIPGFAERWATEVRVARDLIDRAARLRDALDMAFGRLLEARYREVVPGEVPSVESYYESFVLPRRRRADGKLARAVLLVVDGLRFDFWRETLRPGIAREYDVEEALGLALLPSQTNVSRRSLFAGCSPRATPRGPETRLFELLLGRVHGEPVPLEATNTRLPGLAFGARSCRPANDLRMAVFDFPDSFAHETAWDPYTLQQVQGPLVTNLRAFLAEAGPEATVFLTADHGHLLQARGAPVEVPGTAEVGYRSARVGAKLQGDAAARVFQIEASVLGHDGGGWFVFPRPGHALRAALPSGRKFRPLASNRHGGISLFEMVVPFVRLSHKAKPAVVSLVASVREAATVGEPVAIEVAVAADGLLSAPVVVSADREGMAPVEVRDAGSTPVRAHLSFTPTAAGRQKIRLTARLGGERVGGTTVEVQAVQPKVVEADAARAKLTKLFGED